MRCEVEGRRRGKERRGEERRGVEGRGGGRETGVIRIMLPGKLHVEALIYVERTKRERERERDIRQSHNIMN